MTHSNALVLVSEVVDLLSLKDLCRICGSSADWVIELVAQGILESRGESSPAWRFESTSITTLRRVQCLQSDLRLNTASVTVVLTLVDQNAALKRELRLLQNTVPYGIPMSGPQE
jgi:hypothetical protein